MAIVSAGSEDYAELAEVTQPTRKRYADRHGYTCFYFEIEKSMGDACKKMAYDQLWGEGFDVFVWMDLDSIIWNPTITIEGIMERWMPSRNDGHVLWGCDHAGPNSGVYMAWFTSEARQFMDRTYATMLENGLADETAAEQVMMIRSIGQYVATCPGYVFNAYDPALYYQDRYTHPINQLMESSLVLHMPGYPNEKRIPELRRRVLESVAKWG